MGDLEELSHLSHLIYPNFSYLCCGLLLVNENLLTFRFALVWEMIGLLWARLPAENDLYHRFHHFLCNLFAECAVIEIWFWFGDAFLRLERSKVLGRFHDFPGLIGVNLCHSFSLKLACKYSDLNNHGSQRKMKVRYLF